MNEFFEMLNKSNLVKSEDAASDFNFFKINLSSEAVSCQELLSIYLIRSNHLEKFISAHATELKLSIEELCRNLLEHKKDYCFIHTLEGSSAKYKYQLFVLKDAKLLLGCIKIIGKLDVSHREWELLWGS